MSRDRLLIFSAALLGVLGILVYKQAKKDEAIGHPLAGASTSDFPSISGPDDITKISVTNGDKGEVVLEQVTDSSAPPTDAGPATMWVVTKPVRADANQQSVKDLIANLKDLKVTSQINLRLDDDTRKEKQLDAAHAVHVVAWKGSDKKVDELFGKSGAAGQLMTLASKPDVVWAAKGYSSYLYTKEPKDFRNKEIFHFDDANALQAVITNTHGTFSFTKTGDKWAAASGTKPVVRFDQEKVKDMLRSYKSLNADDFGDGKSLSETGLDKPEAQLELHLNNDSKAYQLSIGKVSAGTNRWAKRSDSDTIYQLANYASDWLTSDVSKYQSPADAGAGDSGAKK